MLRDAIDSRFEFVRYAESLVGGQPTFDPLARALAEPRNSVEPDLAFAEVGSPAWDGLPLDQYLSLLDMLNPMHRLWSDGRWNKLTVAHSC